MTEDLWASGMTDEEKTQWLLGLYFRTQATIEKYMGREGLPEWTEYLAQITANMTKKRFPEALDQARSLVTALATMLEIYGSETTLTEHEDKFRLDVHKCGIWDYRERAQQQGVELTLKTPCEFCVDLRYRTAAHLGVPVRHKLGNRNCWWESSKPVGDTPQEVGDTPQEVGEA